MSLPFFNLYPRDFEADTSHLTLEEDGAYNRLIRLCWMTPGCSLPDDDAWIMRRMRVDAETFERVVRVVLDEFFTRSGGRVSNARIAKEHAKSSEAHKKRVSAGAKGGKAKALKTNKNTSSNAVALTKQPEPEPEPDIREDTYVSLSPSGDLLHANPVAEAVIAYNEAAGRNGWPKVQRVTPSRRKAVLGRIRDAGGVDGWRSAIERAGSSDFLCGRTAKPWAGFGFDWICKPANFTKLMEGNYDNRGCGRSDSSDRQGWDSDTLDAIAYAAGFEGT